MCKSARDGVAPYRVGVKAVRWLMGDWEKSAFLSKNSGLTLRLLRETTWSGTIEGIITYLCCQGVCEGYFRLEVYVCDNCTTVKLVCFRTLCLCVCMCL